MTPLPSSNDRLTRPDVSLIIPFRNEETFLSGTLDSLLAQELDGITGEIILVDGMSADKSLDIARTYSNKSFDKLVFRLLSNPGKTTPKGFNLGIQSTQAPLVGFGGAHSLYPANYFKLAVDLLKTTDAHVVGGGHTRIIPSEPGPIAEAMSCLYESPLGAGVAAYHRLTKPAYVDTVYGGFYQTEVFDKVGCFNEELRKNQDNEFNARVTDAGFKILFHPGLSTVYIQKTSFQAFLKRAFDFGAYHPTTWKANSKSLRLRHVIPALWVIYLAAMSAGSLLGIAPSVLWLPGVAYLALLTLSGFRLAFKRKSLLVGLATIPLFCAYHVAYGTGTLLGLIQLAESKPTASSVNSIE